MINTNVRIKWHHTTSIKYSPRLEAKVSESFTPFTLMKPLLPPTAFPFQCSLTIVLAIFFYYAMYSVLVVCCAI